MYTKTKILKNHECLTASQYVRADGTGDSRSGMRLSDPSRTKVSAHARSAALSEPASSKWPVRGTATPRVGTGPSGARPASGFQRIRVWKGRWCNLESTLKLARRVLSLGRMWCSVKDTQLSTALLKYLSVATTHLYEPDFLYLHQPKQHSMTDQMQKVWESSCLLLSQI